MKSIHSGIGALNTYISWTRAVYLLRARANQINLATGNSLEIVEYSLNDEFLFFFAVALTAIRLLKPVLSEMNRVNLIHRRWFVGQCQNVAL